MTNKQNEFNNSEDEIDEKLLLVNELVDSKDYDSALAYLDELIDKYNSFKVFNEKGVLLIKLEKFEEAINCFDNSLDVEVNYDAYIGKALTFYELFKSDNLNNVFFELDMVENLEKACKLNSEGFLIESRIFFELEEYDKASDNLNIYIEYNGDIIQNDKDLYIKILYELANLYHLKNRYKNAFYTLHELLTFDKNNIDGLMLMGFVAPYLNKYNYALKCFDRIFNLNNKFYDAMIFKGELLVYLHRYDEALDCFEICPKEVITNDYIKLIEYAKSQLEEGVECEYFGLSKINFGEYKYCYTCIKDGFRKFYGQNLRSLSYKLDYEGLLFRVIKYSEDYSVNNYLECYLMFPNYNSKYKTLFSSLFNNKFLEDVDKDKVDLEDLLISKNETEKRIIKRSYSLFKSRLKYAHKSNYTGLFGVVRSRWGLWCYVDLVRAVFMGWNLHYAESLDELENLVKELGYFWYEFDEELSKEYREEYEL